MAATRRLVVIDKFDILPFRIAFFDESDLPNPLPLLEAFLAGDRVNDEVVPFEVDQARDVVARRKTSGIGECFVFEKSSVKV